MKRETSFGIIPLSKGKGEWQVLLICHKKGGHWSFPKGHGEPGEDPKETAQRELLEETGLHIDKWLKEEPFTETYIFQRGSLQIQKTVHYYVAEVSGNLKLQLEEVNEAKWVKLIEANQAVTFPESKKIVNSLLMETL